MKTETQNQLKKRKCHAFDKDIFLIGIDTNGENVWLEAASWDCGWYWGFGYIERYTNNNHPDMASDISSHTHWDTKIVGKQDNRDYIHHLNENPLFSQTVLTDSESWKLAELMKTAYTLKGSAEMFRRGVSHITSDEQETGIVQRKNYAKEINEVILPKLFKLIYELLEA